MTLRRRLMLTMLGMVIVAQLIVAVATLGNIRHYAIQNGAHELGIATNVARQLIDERVRQLADSAAMLAANGSFAADVATRDSHAIGEELRDYGERAGADMVMLVGPEGQLLAGSHWLPGSLFPYRELLQRARSEQYASAVLIDQRQPYKLVMVPVPALDSIGWIGMGLQLDDALADEISGLIQRPATFIADTDTDASPQVEFVAGALKGAGVATVDSLGRALAQGRYLDSALPFSPNDALTRAARLGENSSGSVYIVIQQKFDELLAAFNELSWQLLGIFAVMLVIAALAAGFSARSMAAPLIRLSEAAGRIGRGERANLSPERFAGDMAVLATTLKKMEADIDTRERTLRYQSYHDQLTGLANRQSAQKDLEAGVEGEASFTLIRLSIRGFRHINDTFGYATGDFVLQTMARRLLTLIGSGEQAYRLGGDEFLLWLTGSEASEARVQELHRQLRVPIVLDESPLSLSIASGEVSFPLHGYTAWQLLRRAEIAMDRAKASRMRHLRYLEGQDEQHQRRLMLVRDLQHAAAQGQLKLVYQPQIDTKSGEINGFEALMRWHHPTLGLVSPDEFIGLAEQSGNIALLTRWLIDSVGRQMAEWEARGRMLRISINLSAQDVIDPALPDRLESVMHHYRLSPARLCLEVTESAIIQDPVLAHRTLEKLRCRGFRIAVDDFGTGYSSLSQIRSLPIEELKIDKSFIFGLDDSADDRTIVRSTIELGHNLGLEIVAEGVESSVSRQLLNELGCDYLQGYFISRPMAVEDVPDWIEQYDSQKSTGKGSDKG
ncbi:bifunctional diguanylate cyclase/phosphodiesterase [Kushneria aurantia]|uniref:EAL domain-containing protein n=1 Tax=Kushneria aurantia TaxID=504092 RepID=A0ABV6FYJ4_9GAMM|nr:EAL domain-containing protein [Kushneria aurantia]